MKRTVDVFLASTASTPAPGVLSSKALDCPPWNALHCSDRGGSIRRMIRDNYGTMAEISLRAERSIGGLGVVHLTLSSPSIPSAFDGYRIVQLSDLHYGYLTPRRHIERAVRAALSLAPDLAVITGDFIQRHRRANRTPVSARITGSVVPMIRERRGLREVALQLGEMLSPLTPSDGLVGILGNHDYMEGVRTIRRRLPQTMHWLVNQSLFLKRGSDLIQIAGIDDLWYGEPDLHAALGNPLHIVEAGVVNDARSRKNSLPAPSFRILLAHNPDVTVLKTFREGLVDLILCGHTHGGQICMPFVGPIITHTKQRVHVGGLSWCGTTPVYTSRGIGYGVLPIRLNCPAEITSITLRSER